MFAKVQSEFSQAIFPLILSLSHYVNRYSSLSSFTAQYSSSCTSIVLSREVSKSARPTWRKAQEGSFLSIHAGVLRSGRCASTAATSYQSKLRRRRPCPSPCQTWRTSTADSISTHDRKSRALVFNGNKWYPIQRLSCDWTYILERQRQSSTRANHVVVVCSYDLSEEVVKKIISTKIKILDETVRRLFL